jgi:hypothetical protein
MNEYSYHTITNTTIAFENKDSETILEIDGELKRVHKDKLQIHVFNKSLNVISPSAHLH